MMFCRYLKLEFPRGRGDKRAIMQVIVKGDKNKLRGSLSILFIRKEFLPQLLVNILFGVFENVTFVISS